MTKKRAKIMLGIAGFVLFCVVGFFGLFFYDTYIGFGAPTHPAFSGYQPTVMPNNIRVTGQSLTRNHQVGMAYWTFNYELKTSSKDIAIREVQMDRYEISPINCKGYGDICTTTKTPHGKVYRVWYGLYKDKPFGLQIEWLEGNTHISVSVSDATAANFVNYNWTPVVDSTQKVDLSHMPYAKVNHQNRGV